MLRDPSQPCKPLTTPAARRAREEEVWLLQGARVPAAGRGSGKDHNSGGSPRKLPENDTAA